MAEDRNGRRSNNPPRHQVEPISISRDDLREMFKPYPEIRMAPGNAPYFLVKVPFDKGINAEMAAMRAHFEPRSKNWRVRVMHYKRLFDLAPEIHRVAEADWHDAINAGAREAAEDRRVFIPESEIAEYPLNELVFRDGKEWIVTHIGRPREKDGVVKCPVWLSPPAKLDPPLEENFGAAGQ